MLFSILLISGLSSGVFSKIETGPKNTIAKVGGTVVFPCVTGSKDCTGIDWAKQENIQSSVAIYKNSSGMLNNNTYPWARYKVSSVGGCNLTILGLKLDDSGLYSCSETQDRHFVLVVVEYEEKCQTNATAEISNGTVYNNECKAKFNPNLIKPWKIELSWSGVSSSAPVKSTEADTVVLAYTGTAAPPDVQGFECTVSLSVEQTLQESHDKTVPRFQACTLPSLKVRYPVTKITCTGKSGSEKVKFRKSETVNCNADGYPPPTCECKSNKANGKTFNCSQFTIPETSPPGDTYTCTATNDVTDNSLTTTLTVTEDSEDSLSGGAIAAIVICSLLGIAVVVILAVFLPRKLNLGKRNRQSESDVPLKKDLAPPKPPRANSTNSNPIYRPQSDVQYAQLAKEENPRMMPTNRPPPSTIYAQVNNA